MIRGNRPSGLYGSPKVLIEHRWHLLWHKGERWHLKFPETVLNAHGDNSTMQG